VQPYLINKFVEQYGEIIKLMEKYFTYKPGSYYSQAVFFVSICLHDLLPKEVEELIFLDVDLEFRGSILELEHHFQDFDSRQMLGMAPELSPVYHHILYEFRKKHKKTLLGAPKGKGFPGYNSGVVLMKLDRLRTSDLYKTLISNSSLASLTSKYFFRGHLGDQDFYTLVALEHPELFYTLPCNWNRQLCQWWKSKGYDDQFDDFYQCQGFINVYHGNCNSLIPAET
jgi:xylosyl alpha-1,3-xylosyltransferase